MTTTGINHISPQNTTAITVTMTPSASGTAAGPSASNRKIDTPERLISDQTNMRYLNGLLTRTTIQGAHSLCAPDEKRLWFRLLEVTQVPQLTHYLFFFLRTPFPLRTIATRLRALLCTGRATKATIALVIQLAVWEIVFFYVGPDVQFGEMKTGLYTGMLGTL
mgnify:CR=1 FL=1